MSNGFRKTLAVVLLLAAVLVDFTSRILSVGVDLILAGGIIFVMWPLMFSKKA